MLLSPLDDIQVELDIFTEMIFYILHLNDRLSYFNYVTFV